MRIAVHQPYLFPFLPYFRVIAAVDLFVLGDDLQFIMRGWINRNSLPSGPFTMPIAGASPRKNINELHYADDPRWTEKFWKRLEQTYARAPGLEPTLDLIKNVLASGTNVAKRNEFALRLVCKRLGIKTPFVRTSDYPHLRALAAQVRVIELCRIFGAGEFINSVGGKDLYDAAALEANDIHLTFVENEPGPSVLHYLMLARDFSDLARKP